MCVKVPMSVAVAVEMTVPVTVRVPGLVMTEGTDTKLSTFVTGSLFSHCLASSFVVVERLGLLVVGRGFSFLVRGGFVLGGFVRGRVVRLLAFVFLLQLSHGMLM